MIIRDNRLVYEEYFSGEDERRGRRLGVVEHNRDTLHDLRSVTKSVVSAAVMIAVAKGKIKSVEQPIFDFFPEYIEHATGMKKDITIKDLLTMSSGLEWNEAISYTDPRNSETSMDNSSDPIGFVLSQKAIQKPGTVFNYCGGCTQVLAAIVKKSTGLDVDEFAAKNLFAPLGISKFEWLKRRSGMPIAASGLRLRSRDMAKFGLLYMNKGKWDGERIIPSNLVDYSLKEQILTPHKVVGGSIGYGYQFWRWAFPINNVAVSLVGAGGNGGQLIVIDKKLDLIVIITAGNYNRSDLKKSSFNIYPDLIYPAVDKTKSRSTK